MRKIIKMIIALFFPQNKKVVSKKTRSKEMKSYPLNPFGVESGGENTIISAFMASSAGGVKVSYNGLDYQDVDFTLPAGFTAVGMICAAGWWVLFLTNSSGSRSIITTKNFVEFNQFNSMGLAGSYHYARRRFKNPYDRDNQYLPVGFLNSLSASLPGVFYYLLDKDTGNITRHKMFVGTTQNASYAAANWGQYDEYTGAMFIGFGTSGTAYYKRMYYNFTPTSNTTTPYTQFFKGSGGSTASYVGYKFLTGAITFNGNASTSSLVAWNGATVANTTAGTFTNVQYNSTSFYGVNGVNATLFPASNTNGVVYVHTAIGAPSKTNPMAPSAGSNSFFTNMIIAGNNSDCKSEYIIYVLASSTNPFTDHSLRIYDVARDAFFYSDYINEGAEANLRGDIYYSASLKRLFIYYKYITPNNKKLAITTCSAEHNFGDYVRDASFANNATALFAVNVD